MPRVYEAIERQTHNSEYVMANLRAIFNIRCCSDWIKQRQCAQMLRPVM